MGMMTTSWFDGQLSKAKVNGDRLCAVCGGREEHCIVDEEGNKTRLCDACFKSERWREKS